MTFEKYLEALRDRNPAMRDAGKVTISIESFEAQLKRAFEAGQEDQRDFQRMMDKIRGEGRGSFGGLFG